jgi:hypothetical protein
MATHPPKQPAWDAGADPVKLRCGGKTVFGWVYADGTVEMVCRNRACGRPGHETRHLFNPVTGLCVDLHFAPANQPPDTGGKG